MPYTKKGILFITKALVCLTGFLAACAIASAQTIDWTGGAGDGLWDTSGNWAGGNVPNTSGENPEFDTASFVTPGAQAVTLSNPTTIGSLRINTTDSITINGSTTLTTGNAITGVSSVAPNLTINPNISTSSVLYFTGFSGGQITFNGSVSQGGDMATFSPSTQITFNGNISGSGRLYIEDTAGDSGRMTITAANSYTGNTTVRGGTLAASGDATFGDGTGTILIIGRSTTTTSDAVLELSNLNNSISNPYTFGGDGQSGAGVLRLTSGSATFTGAGRTTGNGGSTTIFVAVTGTTLTFANTLTTYSGNTIVFDGDGDVSTSGSGAIIQSSGTADLRKGGTGTLTYGGAANTYAGSTTINGGSLVLNATGNSIADGGLILNSGTSASLSKSDQIGSSILTLNSATFNTNGFDEALGALILLGDSNFNLGSGDSVIAFADSSGQSWTAGQTFILLKWTGSLSGGGTDQVLFGSDASGLTSGQLGQITFRDPDGLGLGDYAAQILGTGEVVPVPEASTYALVLGLVAGVYLIYRKRKNG